MFCHFFKLVHGVTFEKHWIFIFVLKLSSGTFFIFTFELGGKTLAQRQGIARASFWQILVQISLQET